MASLPEAGSALRNGSGYAIALNRLKWLGVCLVCSNLFLGGLSTYMLHRDDSNYSQLLKNSVPLMNEVRHMGEEEGISFRGVIEAFVANDAVSTEISIKRARDAMSQERVLRHQLEKMDLLKDQSALIGQLDEAADAFDRDAEIMLRRVKATSSADAEHEAISHLSRSTDQYSLAVQSIADYIESRTALIRHGYNLAARNQSAFVIGLAGWPIFLVGIIILVTGVVVTIMLFSFRQSADRDGLFDAK